MPEAIASNVVANIVTKLEAVAFHEIRSHLKDDLNKLHDTLSTIKTVLVDADRRQGESNQIQLWIGRLNDVVYDADNLLDAFHTKNLQRENGKTKMQEVCEFFSSSSQLAFRRYKLGRKIKKIRERFDKIATDMSTFNFVTERVIDRARVDGRDWETDSRVDSIVIGREREKKEIIDMLTRSSTEENVSIISIVGIGGLGKTTLTDLVYCDKKVVEHFESMMWVCVSEDFGKKSLVRRILKSITNKDVGDLDMDQLQRQLREHIDGKRYLLVLDDVWNQDYEKWADVKKFLVGGARGSKIMVTTRSQTVSSVMGVEDPYMLAGLTEEQSWNLFENIAFLGRKEVHPNIKAIGKQIITRCKGVPLALRSLGSVMKPKANESEWLVIQNWDFWSLYEFENIIFPILKLSYDHLPIHLRQCFAFCSLFPKDHEFEKDLLVQLWIAQGYIQSPSGSQILEEIGGQYFEDLLSRSFFQGVQRVGYSNEILSCKMHDLIHDLALYVAGTCYRFIAQNDATTNISERLIHVSFENLSQGFSRQLLQARGLRTYFFVDRPFYSYSELCRANIFLLSKFKRVRVLDLRHWDFKELPKWVCKMQHLRYLDLSGNGEMKVIPNSITNLVNLQMLNLSKCDELKELPEGIGKLISLRHLVIDGCSKISYMPRGLEKLTSLRTLSRFIVSDDKRSSIGLGALKGLNNLAGRLSIEKLEKVRDARLESKASNLMGKLYLRHLNLKWNIEDDDGSEKFGVKDKDDDAKMSLEGLQPHPNLKKLGIEGYGGARFPNWMMGNMGISLPNIVEISLRSCPNIRKLPPFYQLPCLKSLSLRNQPKVEYGGDGDGSSSSSSSPSFPCLTSLRIWFCPMLTSMPLAPLLEELELVSVSEKLLCQQLSSSPCLKSLYLENLPKVEEYGCDGDGHGSSSPSFPCLTELIIRNCPMLTSMPLAPLLERLELHSVSEKLVCQQLSSSPLSRLNFLVNISLENCPNIQQLPPFYQLPCLKTLHLGGLPKVEYSGDGDGSSSSFFSSPVFPSLTFLSISECPMLTSMPLAPLLETLILESVSEKLVCQKLSSSASALSRSSSLIINDCKEVDLSADGMNWQSLSSLSSLKIQELPKLVSLPEGLQHVTTLQFLEIYECPGLVALPEWMSNLTSLKRLRIYGCPLLSERCKKDTGEDWPNIAHIPNIQIDFESVQGRL